MERGRKIEARKETVLVAVLPSISYPDFWPWPSNPGLLALAPVKLGDFPPYPKLCPSLPIETTWICCNYLAEEVQAAPYRAFRPGRKDRIQRRPAPPIPPCLGLILLHSAPPARNTPPCPFHSPATPSLTGTTLISASSHSSGCSVAGQCMSLC